MKIKELITVLIAAPVGFYIAHRTDFGFMLNILIFLGLYLSVALIVEAISRLIAKKTNDSKKKTR